MKLGCCKTCSHKALFELHAFPLLKQELSESPFNLSDPLIYYLRLVWHINVELTYCLDPISASLELFELILCSDFGLPLGNLRIRWHLYLTFLTFLILLFLSSLGRLLCLGRLEPQHLRLNRTYAIIHL
jgi:hypothetical protein